MYEPPIELTYVDELKTQINEFTEGVVMEAVTKVGVYVDKDELIKAINNERNQYEKGYRDGMSDAVFVWHPCSDGEPKTNGTYLVTFLSESGRYADMIEVIGIAYWTGLRWLMDCDDLEDVIAWAEPPKPYEREVDE